VKYFDSAQKKIGLSICIAIVLMAFYWGVKNEYKKYILRRDGIEAIGTLTFSVAYSDNYTWGYTFIVNGKEYQGSSADDCSKAIIGGPISVIYLPTDPSDNEPACVILGANKAKYP
jgi:hypothetical protein